MTTVAGMLWELLVIGLLCYGLAVAAIAAIAGPGNVRRLVCPDVYDAPIRVTRRGDRATTATAATRSEYSDG